MNEPLANPNLTSNPNLGLPSSLIPMHNNIILMVRSIAPPSTTIFFQLVPLGPWLQLATGL
jgi:hypothetical protein